MSGSIDWREAPVGRHHDRKSFDCGSPELNGYLERFARQNHESGGAKTFVAVAPAEPARVLGYYSISPGAIEFARVPAILLAAGIRALSVADQIGGVALAIDAKDERAAGWYQRFGAIRLLDDPLKLILALGAITDAVAAPEGKRRLASRRLGGP